MLPQKLVRYIFVALVVQKLWANTNPPTFSIFEFPAKTDDQQQLKAQEISIPSPSVLKKFLPELFHFKSKQTFSTFEFSRQN